MKDIRNTQSKIITEEDKMKKYFVLDCRDTGRGAFTTMNGEKFAVSKTGNHWTERIPVQVGDNVTITDISNSGKHNCRIIQITKVTPEIEYRIVRQADPYAAECPICEEA